MKSTLLASIALLLAACGSSDTAGPGTANEAAPADPTVNEAGLAPAPMAAPVADPRRADVVNAAVKIVGAVDPSARTAIGFADIGGDEREEALVYLVDPGLCGSGGWPPAAPAQGSGGCSLVVLTPSGKSWRSIGQTSVTQLPVHRLLTKKDGWNDLAVGVSGGGATPHIALLRFSGGRYPSNPSTQPILNRLPEGARELIADDAAALTPAR